MKKNLVKMIAITLAAIMLLCIGGAVAERYIVSNTYRLPTVKTRPVEAPEILAGEETVPAEEVTEEAPVAEEVIEEAPATEEVTVEELPTPVVSVSSNLTGETAVTVGTEMVLTLHISGVDGYDYTIQWQQTTDGITWTDMPGETGHELHIILQPAHAGVYWRAVVQVTGPSAE